MSTRSPNSVVAALSLLTLTLASAVACSGGGTETAASSTLATGGATGSIFKVESHCQHDAQSDRYLNCGGLRQGDFPTGAVSATDNDTLNGLEFESNVVVSFFCSALSATGAGAPYTHGAAYGVIAPTTTTILSSEAKVPKTGGSFHLEFNPAGKIFKPNCELKVITNITYPPVAVLEIYASGLRRLQRKLARVYEDVTPTADHVEAIEAMDEGIETLELLLDLQTSALTKRKIEDAKTRLAAARSAVSVDCGTGTASLCTQALADARTQIAADVAAAATEITQLRTFVDAESGRLAGIAGALGDRIEGLTRASACLDLTRPVGEVCH